MGDEGGGINVSEFDFQLHNVKLVQVPPGADGKTRTQLVFADKSGTVSLMLDVQAASGEAVKAAAKAMGPLLSSSFDLLLSEMEKENSDKGWGELCDEINCKELKPLFSKTRLALPQTPSSNTNAPLPSPTAAHGFSPPPVKGRNSTGGGNLLGVDEGVEEEEVVETTDNSLSAKFISMAESSIDLNKPMKGDITPLLLATQVCDVDAVRVCLERGANPSLANASGITPVLHAVQHGAVDVLQLFMAVGAKPNEKAEDGTTPLHVAAESGQEGCLQVLLEWGADVDMKASEGATAALFAVQSNSVGCLELLLAGGADPNIATVDQWTPLLLAVQEDYHQCVQLLIDAGANPRAKNHDSDTAVLLAAQYNAATSLAIVLKAGADTNNGRGGLAGAVCVVPPCPPWPLPHNHRPASCMGPTRLTHDVNCGIKTLELTYCMPSLISAHSTHVRACVRLGARCWFLRVHDQ